MVDKELLEIYMQGFNDELDRKEDIKFYITDSPYKSSAYKLGKWHATIGDDIRSVDYLSNEEILKMIKL